LSMSPFFPAAFCFFLCGTTPCRTFSLCVGKLISEKYEGVPLTFLPQWSDLFFPIMFLRCPLFLQDALGLNDLAVARGSLGLPLVPFCPRVPLSEVFDTLHGPFSGEGRDQCFSIYSFFLSRLNCSVIMAVSDPPFSRIIF